MMNSIVLSIGMAWALLLPLAWKWQLGMKRVSIFVSLSCVAFVCAFRLAGLDMSIWLNASVSAASSVAVAAAYLAYRFYRDPEREAPSSNGAIVSPADGVIIYVKSSRRGELPVATKYGRQCLVEELIKTPFYSSEAWVIGISMSLLDVHVNRTPIGGRVIFQRHFPGKFGSLRVAEREFDNERATTMVQTDDLQVAIVQIASRLVRQIVSYVEVGDELVPGQRVGAIRLGSQVDLILPVRPDLDVTVEVGAEVRAGETVLATYAGKPHVDNPATLAELSVRR